MMEECTIKKDAASMEKWFVFKGKNRIKQDLVAYYMWTAKTRKCG